MVKVVKAVDVLVAVATATEAWVVGAFEGAAMGVGAREGAKVVELMAAVWGAVHWAVEVTVELAKVVAARAWVEVMDVAEVVAEACLGVAPMVAVQEVAIGVAAMERDLGR